MTTHNKTAHARIKEFIESLSIGDTFSTANIVSWGVDKDAYSISNILRGNFTNIKYEGRGVWRKVKPDESNNT